MDMGDLILLAIGVTVGVSLTPAVSSASTAAAINASATTAALLALVPFIYVAVIIGSAALYLRHSFKGRK